MRIVTSARAKRLCAIAAVLALAAAVAGAPTTAQAQAPPTFVGPGGPNNPLQANPMALLQRPEVQTELRLDLKQKSALADLQSASVQEMGSRIRQAVQGLDFQNLRGMSPQEVQQRMQEVQPRIQAAVQSWQGELNDKIKAILRPDQAARLHQLDLQRRGPLALGDTKVQDELKIAQDHRAAIQKLVGEYQQQSQKLMQDAFQQVFQNGPPPPSQRPRLPDFNSPLSPWKQKRDKLKKDAEDKVLAALSDDERASWKAALGTPFAFRGA